MSLKGLRRIPERGVIAGVCAGIAEYFDWNVRLLRAVLVVGLFFSGVFPIIVVYLVLWYVMAPLTPAENAGLDRTGDLPGRPTSMGDVKTRFEKLDERLRHIEECVTEREFELRRELKKLET
jgi:phage shock protein C